MVERKSGGSNFLHKYDVSYTLGGNCDKLSCKRTKTGKSRAVSSVWHGKFKRRPEYFNFDGTAVFDNLIIRIFVYRAALAFRRKNSILLFSAFLMSVVLIGNHAMVLRSSVATPRGIETWQAVVTDILLILLCWITGERYVNRMDWIGKRKEN